ncbi:hypothetical protein IMY05_005G0118100 [Salix suchowensis]|nr:hypothetical protein IMY05_005G0118100 [Salix suchowensis]
MRSLYERHCSNESVEQEVPSIIDHQSSFISTYLSIYLSIYSWITELACAQDYEYQASQFQTRDLRSGRTFVPLHQPASFGGLMTSYTCADTSRVRHESVVNCGRLLDSRR